MDRLLIAEGGYQEFVLQGGEWALLVAALVVAGAAILAGVGLRRLVLRSDAGPPSMTRVADVIHDGALTYVKRQARTIGLVLLPVAAVVFATSVAVVRPDGSTALSFWESGVFRTAAFLAGCAASGAIGFLGMSLATRGNVRTAAAAHRGSFPDAVTVAIRSGGVAGLFTVGLGLLGASLIVVVFQNSSAAILIGFGFGGSLMALFLRVGGGIFTKAADVGADLVGKVEEGIPEDDPRNPATIADNVGDNVGDCAGMASDLFESDAVILVAAVVLGVSAFASVGANPALGLVFPVAAKAVGVVASMAGIVAVRARVRDADALAPINRGFLVAGGLSVAGIAALAWVYVGGDAPGMSLVGTRVLAAVVVGVLLAQALSRLTAYYTGARHRPVRDIAEAARTGPATVVLSGVSSGMQSTVAAVLTIAAAIGTAVALGGGNVQFSLYLVALCGIGMLATAGMIVSEDTFGPVADNAAGIAEMSGGLDGEAERILVGLDAVGNTTKAVTKGFAIGSAVIAAVALFASFIETAGREIFDAATLRALVEGPRGVLDALPVTVTDPKVFIGLLVGGAVPFLFASLAIRAVGRTAQVVVHEVRDQFADGAILRGTRQPDYAPVIDICTVASLRELATPALLAVSAPVIVGFGLGWTTLAAFLAGVILTGQLLAVFLANAGGAWDNAKKYVEAGALGGKHSPAHRATVIGDTVGDPFKDTAGPALNPLIKVMNLVSLLILPAVIALADGELATRPSAASLGVAAAAGLVLAAALVRSELRDRRTPQPPAVPAGAGTGESAGDPTVVYPAAPASRPPATSGAAAPLGDGARDGNDLSPARRAGSDGGTMAR